MRVAVVGSRTFDEYALLEFALNKFDKKNLVIISGGARGADTLAERWADENGVKKIIYKANWEKYGRGAGYVRNEKIVGEAEAVVAFWDGRSKGTKHALRIAEKKGIKKLIYYV